jgi:hypothetical protein
MFTHIYKDEQGNFHEVCVHNFIKDNTKEVRVCGHVDLNPQDKNYPDKKIVPISSLYELKKSKFSEEFIKNNTF